MAKQKKEKNNKKHFVKDFKSELKKVIWPTKNQLINNTMIVIAMVIVITAIVFVLDLAFEAGNKYGINKMKESVKSSISEKTDESDTSDSEEATDEETTDEEVTDAEENEETTTEENENTENSEKSTETSSESSVEE